MTGIDNTTLEMSALYSQFPLISRTICLYDHLYHNCLLFHSLNCWYYGYHCHFLSHIKKCHSHIQCWVVWFSKWLQTVPLSVEWSHGREFDLSNQHNPSLAGRETKHKWWENPCSFMNSKIMGESKKLLKYITDQQTLPQTKVLLSYRNISTY